MNLNPNSRQRAPGFPPQFVSAPVPTAWALYNQIPSAVQFNLHRVINEGIRHEQNAYGYFNSAFVSIFSPTQRFQINPQYPARPAVEMGVGRHGRNISVGSTGEIHAGQGTGRERAKFPDFTVSKPLPRQPPTPRVHCNIGIIEIKTEADADLQGVERDYQSVDEAVLQAVEYAELLSTTFSVQEQNSLCIATYVVYGKYYTRITFQYQGDLLSHAIEDWQFVFEDFALAEGRAPFLYRLCELAVRNWDLDG